MPEFTLRLDDCEIVRDFTERLNAMLEDPLVVFFNGSASFDGRHLTADVDAPFPRLTIYYGLVLFVAGGFSMLYWNLSVLTLIPAMLLTSLALIGTSYYYLALCVYRLWRLGYRGKIRIVHAEGVF